MVYGVWLMVWDSGLRVKRVKGWEDLESLRVDGFEG